MRAVADCAAVVSLGLAAVPMLDDERYRDELIRRATAPLAVAGAVWLVAELSRLIVAAAQAAAVPVWRLGVATVCRFRGGHRGGAGRAVRRRGSCGRLRGHGLRAAHRADELVVGAGSPRWAWRPGCSPAISRRARWAVWRLRFTRWRRRCGVARWRAWCSPSSIAASGPGCCRGSRSCRCGVCWRCWSAASSARSTRLGSPAELYATGYGRVLSAKIAVTAALVVLGWRNRTIWLPAARCPPRHRRGVAIAVARRIGGDGGRAGTGRRTGRHRLAPLPTWHDGSDCRGDETLQRSSRWQTSRIDPTRSAVRRRRPLPPHRFLGAAVPRRLTPSAARAARRGAARATAGEDSRQAAKKQPAKAQKKAPAKSRQEGPAKAAKKAAPAKKAAKKAPAKKAPPPPPEARRHQRRPRLGGERGRCQGKIDGRQASNPVSGPAPVPLIGPEPSRLPIAAAIAAGVLAILVVLLARRRSDDG